MTHEELEYMYFFFFGFLLFKCEEALNKNTLNRFKRVFK